MQNEIQNQMRAYLEKGFSVIPVGRDKKPLISTWKEYQFRKPTEAEIAGWCETLNLFGIGIVTGKISGVVVLDIDAGAEAESLELPPTPSVKTGGGGWHYYFKNPTGATLQSSIGFRHKMDFKAEGGYVIAPPSLHSSGKNYEWAIPLEEASLAELPNWLKEKIGSKSATRKEWDKITAGVGEGERNDSIAAYIGKILHGLPEADWEDVGWGSAVAVNDRNRPPLSKEELRSVFDSIVAREKEQREKDPGAKRCAALLKAVPKDISKDNLIDALKPLLEALANGKSISEAELYIRNTVKNEFHLNTKDTDSILKYFKEIRKPILAKKEVEKKKAEQTATEPPPTEEERRVAEQALKSPTLLYDVLRMVKKLGVVGEEKNILLHYIIFTSRNLESPLSATVKGDSSSGKSYTLLTTMKLFPKSAYIDLTDATPQSFYYTPDGHFKHKIIVLFEKQGGERADYTIRTLQSEGKLKIQVTVKNSDTGAFESQTIEKEGPTGFVTTTTASLIHAENDTRNISMFPDQSHEQTSRVYESVDFRYLGKPRISDDELKPWHHAQVILEQSPVYIPFVESFRKYFPAHIIRTRRDYGHFLAIVETIAFLHQKQRDIVELHGIKNIRATLADAYMAKIIVEDSLAKSIYELPEKTIEVIQAARKLSEASSNDSYSKDFSEESTFTVTQLAKKLEWDRDTAAKWLKPAAKKGYVTVVMDSKGSKGAIYKVEDKDLPSDGFLPSVEQLAADNPTESVEGIYNPLTGEVKVVERTAAICTDTPTRLEGP